MGSHEQETRYMECLRQELNYVKTNKSDEENSYDMIKSNRDGSFSSLQRQITIKLGTQ
jgi:hypothetical protein